VQNSDALPADVRVGVARALHEDSESAFSEVDRIGGGCISPAARIRAASGRTAFLKWSDETGSGGFGVEAAGLTALAETGGLRVPEVIAFEVGAAGVHGWILLEFIETGRSRPETASLLASGLTAVHRRLAGSAPGWEEDGYIGSLPQANQAHGGSWPDFWREQRLRKQWAMAETYFDRETHRRWERLMVEIDPLLRAWETDGLSLLHGDLWSGNVLTDRDGVPVLVDPAVYRGHREVDLAMMELFGGFDSEVFHMYEKEAPLEPGYREFRRDLYQLYPLLVHVNLFGRGYVTGVRERVMRLTGRL
jgi:fructosamine-3-kinase